MLPLVMANWQPGHKHRKIFRPGADGTEWPETVMGQGVGSPLSMGSR